MEKYDFFKGVLWMILFGKVFCRDIDDVIYSY